MWVSWFKQHRRILTADLVHIKRADGQSIDGIVHVDAGAPNGDIGLAAFFNPTGEQLTTTIMLPLYYAGVKPGSTVNVTRAEPAGALLAMPHTPATARGTKLTATIRSRVPLVVTVAPNGYAMFVIRGV